MVQIPNPNRARAGVSPDWLDSIHELPEGFSAKLLSTTSNEFKEVEKALRGRAAEKKAWAKERLFLHFNFNAARVIKRYYLHNPDSRVAFESMYSRMVERIFLPFLSVARKRGLKSAMNVLATRTLTYHPKNHHSFQSHFIDQNAVQEHESFDERVHRRDRIKGRLPKGAQRDDIAIERSDISRALAHVGLDLRGQALVMARIGLTHPIKLLDLARKMRKTGKGSSKSAFDAAITHLRSPRNRKRLGI